MAIKVLNRGSTLEERAALESRFAREVNMMSRVKHENLVKVRNPAELCLHFSKALFFFEQQQQHYAYFYIHVRLFIFYQI